MGVYKVEQKRICKYPSVSLGDSGVFLTREDYYNLSSKPLIQNDDVHIYINDISTSFINNDKGKSDYPKTFAKLNRDIKPFYKTFSTSSEIAERIIHAFYGSLSSRTSMNARNMPFSFSEEKHALKAYFSTAMNLIIKQTYISSLEILLQKEEASFIRKIDSIDRDKKLSKEEKEIEKNKLQNGFDYLKEVISESKEGSFSIENEEKGFMFFCNVSHKELTDDIYIDGLCCEILLEEINGEYILGYNLVTKCLKTKVTDFSREGDIFSFKKYHKANAMRKKRKYIDALSKQKYNMCRYHIMNELYPHFINILKFCGLPFRERAFNPQYLYDGHINPSILFDTDNLELNIFYDKTLQGKSVNVRSTTEEECTSIIREMFSFQKDIIINNIISYDNSEQLEELQEKYKGPFLVIQSPIRGISSKNNKIEDYSCSYITNKDDNSSKYYNKGGVDSFIIDYNVNDLNSLMSYKHGLDPYSYIKAKKMFVLQNGGEYIVSQGMVVESWDKEQPIIYIDDPTQPESTNIRKRRDCNKRENGRVERLIKIIKELKIKKQMSTMIQEEVGLILFNSDDNFDVILESERNRKSKNSKLKSKQQLSLTLRVRNGVAFLDKDKLKYRIINTVSKEEEDNFLKITIGDIAFQIRTGSVSNRILNQYIEDSVKFYSLYKGDKVSKIVEYFFPHLSVASKLTKTKVKIKHYSIASYDDTTKQYILYSRNDTQGMNDGFVKDVIPLSITITKGGKLVEAEEGYEYLSLICHLMTCEIDYKHGISNTTILEKFCKNAI